MGNIWSRREMGSGYRVRTEGTGVGMDGVRCHRSCGGDITPHYLINTYNDSYVMRSFMFLNRYYYFST